VTVKDKVFVPPVPVTLDGLKQRITTATAGVGEDMLTRVWQDSTTALIYGL
jgi:hypothetical protein